MAEDAKIREKSINARILANYEIKKYAEINLII